MIKFTSAILGLFMMFALYIGAFAQEEPVKPKPKTTSNPTLQQSTANKLVLKISPNLKCRLKIDGEDKGIIEADAIKKVPLAVGEYKIKAISTEDNRDWTSFVYIVDKESLNQEKLYEINLLSVRDARIIKEQALIEAAQQAMEKAKADSIAKVKAAFEAKQAALQQAKADSIQKLKDEAFNLLPTETTDKYGIVCVKVKGGTFTMGCTSEQGSDCYDDEKPAHQVTLSGFYIGKYEVTQKQWRDVMGSDPPELFFKGCDDCPVEDVSWNDVQEFIAKLNSKTGKTYRLPTEAEWEYAARGGNKSNGFKYSGSNNIDDVAWYDGNSGSKTHPVGQKKANELGIYDMSGNVLEWCIDWYKGYPGSTDVDDYTGPDHVIRGGCWVACGCTSATSHYYGHSFRYNSFGFRLVLVP
jgi:formylglycine-generating enzyme required for sulfatase activity